MSVRGHFPLFWGLPALPGTYVEKPKTDREHISVLPKLNAGKVAEDGYYQV